jgi:CBS domain-containing protein
MQVKDIMSANPACCTPNTALQQVAQMMVDCDCGVIPVVQDEEGRKLLGVITDRDIVCRTIAKGINPLNEPTSKFMSSPVVAAKPEMSLHDCLESMERYQIRRIIVVDDSGACVGVLSQADLASKLSEHETAEILREVSKPSESASQVKEQNP